MSSSSNLVLQINSEPTPAPVISSSEIHDRLEAEMRRDDYSGEELRDSVVSYIAVNSTDDNSNSNRQPARGGPILHTPPTTTQLIKSRVMRFFSRIVHCRYDKRRLPSNKQVVILLVICCFERAAYYAASTGPINTLFHFSPSEAGVSVMVQDVIPQLLFPIAGWAGDVYLGRFKAIQLGLILTALSCSSLLVEATVFYMIFPACSIIDLKDVAVHDQDHCSHFAMTSCSVFSFLLLCAGSSLFQANLIPYGADLITFYRSSNDISSYFYWYYWARNICGPIISISALCLLGLDNNLISVLTCLAACICICIALVICFTTKHWFTNERLYCNPYKKSLQIISYSLRVRRPRTRAAFGIGHDPPPRLDLAKRRHGGRFTNEEVEDVKTVGRLVLLILCFGSLNTIRSAADDGLGYQVGKITPVTVFAKTIGHYNMQCSPAEYYTWILESLLILLLVPLLDQVIYPILGEFTPSMLRRIGIGFCAVILCCGFELGIEHAVVATASNGNVTSCDRDNDNLSSVFTGYYLLLIVILPVLLVTMAEICGTVSGLCFVYAQSPSSTRGMMTGLFFTIAGVFSLLGDSIGTIFALPSFKSKLPASQTCYFWYFLAVLCLSLVGLVVYIVAARMYKNRHRGELETSEPYYFRPRFLNIWGNRRGQKLRDYRENYN